MRVLVTRPAPAGGRTAARLTALGHQPVEMPLFSGKVTATAADFPAADRISGLIATSARAFGVFGGAGGLPPRFSALPVHVVGPRTAAAAREAGFTDVIEAGGSASDLAEALILSFSPSSGVRRAGTKKATAPFLLYLAGVPRKPLIEDALRAANLPLMVFECYEMTEVSYSTDSVFSDILSPPPDAVLLYSANAARRFSELFQGEGLGNPLDSAWFVCLSADIAHELPDAWQARVLIADAPNEDRLLASLARLG